MNKPIYLPYDDLLYKYNTENKSTRDIAKEFEVSQNTVRKELRRYNVPVRQGSEAVRATLYKRTGKQSHFYKHGNKPRFVKYGITNEIFYNLLRKQDYKCVICSKEIDEDSCDIDHCHNSSRVRGLLCPNCNKGLGNFRDNIEFLNNAIVYLKEHNNADFA